MEYTRDDLLGLLISKDYGYRLLPSKAEVNWICGVSSSSNYDKAFTLSPQGLNSVRLNINLSFNLNKKEYIKFISALMNNVKQKVLMPMSYIDPSSVLKECILYPDSIEQTLKSDGRYDISMSTVTDTASAFTDWRDSCFANVEVLDSDSPLELKEFDVFYFEKKFYYLKRDVSRQEIIDKYYGDIVEAAINNSSTKEWFFGTDIPFEFSTKPDFFVNEFKGSYPIRAKKGNFSYDYQDMQFTLSSLRKKKLCCILHFLEHRYGYKNFKVDIEGITDVITDTWWNSQTWEHSWITGDYHSFSAKLNQNHLPYKDESTI